MYNPGLGACDGYCPTFSMLLPDSWEEETKQRVEEITKKVALFILLTAVSGGMLYGGSLMFDLPIHFTAHAGSLVLGGALSLILVGGGYYLYAQITRNKDPKLHLQNDQVARGKNDIAFNLKEDRIHQITSALALILALGIVIAGVSSNTFTYQQWQGMVVGFTFTAAMITLVDDHRERAHLSQNIEERSDSTFVSEEMRLSRFNMKEIAKKIALFLAYSALLGLALYGGARLLGANLNVLAPQGAALVVGGIISLIAIGVFHFLKFHWKHQGNEEVHLTGNKIHILYFSAIVAAISTLAILHFAQVIDLRHIFQNQWEGIVGGALFSASVTQLVAWNREKARIKRLLQSPHDGGRSDSDDS